jgi:hypothetical protein
VLLLGNVDTLQQLGDNIRMRRTIGLIGFGVAASLGSVAHPQSHRQGEQNQGRSELNSSASRIVDAIQDTGPRKDEGCEDRKDHSSDLCAQWKAADAARDAADYTFLAILLSFAGTVLVALTFWEQRKTSRASLRAYVSVRMETFFVPRLDGGNGEVTFALKNGGRTPAYDVLHMGNLAIMGFPLIADPGRIFDKPTKGVNAPAVIHADSEIMGTIKGDTPLEIEKNLGEITGGTKAIYVVGIVSYRDTFGNPHVTEFCQCLTGADYKRSRFASAAKPGEAIPVQWRYANFHNEAT